MKIELQEWHARYLLEAMRQAEMRMAASAEATNDADAQADIGNDMMRFTALRDYVERLAVAAFGPCIKDFHGTPAYSAPSSQSEPLRPDRVAAGE